MSAGTLVDHLGELWELADEATAIFAAGGGRGLTDLDEARLEGAADRALEGLRHTALLAGRDRAAERWLPTALGLGELAVGLIHAAAHAGRPSGPVPGRPTRSGQIGHLAELHPRAATALLACLCARAGAATGGHPRFIVTAGELQTTVRLQPEPTEGPLRSWSAQVEHTTDQLLHHIRVVPTFVAAALAPAGDALVVCDPAPRSRRYGLSDRIPGLETVDVLGSRQSGRWQVPGGAVPDPHRDRLVVSIDPTLLGPLRAATLDRDAAICLRELPSGAGRRST